MTKKLSFVALITSCVACLSSYAGNPASTQYVDQKIKFLQSQIASIAAVPPGGTTGQVLAKINNTNYNTQWVTQSGPQYALGQHIEGGIVFFVYMDSSNVQHALIAASVDESNPTPTYTWDDAVSQCDTKNTGGFTDWHLPNPAQLSALFSNRYAMSPTTVAPYNDPVNNGGFEYARYWNSSEADATNAWFLSFADAVQGVIDKGTTYSVRCIRDV